MRLMSTQSKHNEIGIGSMDAMRGVGAVALLSALRPDELQNFVLSFARHKGVRKHDLKILKVVRIIDSFDGVNLQSFAQVLHELSAGRDDVLIEGRTLVVVLENQALLLPLVSDARFSLSLLISIDGRPKTPRPLLVHLGTRRYAINCHVQ